MTNVINFNEYKSKKNRLEDTQIARRYLYSIDIDSLEVEIAESVFNISQDIQSINVRLNYTQIAKDQNTTVYKVKKAYKNLLDNKVLIEVSKEPGKPVLVSTKNLIIALNITQSLALL